MGDIDLMDYRRTGLTFIAFSTILFCTRYIAAAIYGINSTTWNEDLFQNLILFTGGNTLLTLSIISLTVGILYLLLAEIYFFKKRK